MAKIRKGDNTQHLNVSEDAEKMNHSHIVIENIKYYTHSGKQSSRFLQNQITSFASKAHRIPCNACLFFKIVDPVSVFAVLFLHISHS